MPEAEKRSARDTFMERISDAPYAARGFFESIDEHFGLRNDVDVRFTNIPDMRLWAKWDDADGESREQIFATMYWQPNNQAVFARTKLTPDELSSFGFADAEIPKSATEPQKSEIHLFESTWRFGAEGFIRALEGAKLKLVPMTM